MELRDSDNEEDGEEPNVESDVDDCSVRIHPHRLWQALQFENIQFQRRERKNWRKNTKNKTQKRGKFSPP